jgi:hypothetical protein
MVRTFAPAESSRSRWMAVGLMVAGLILAAPDRSAAQAPAAQVFASDAGMVLNFVKPDKTADFEAVVGKLKESLQKSDKPERKQQAASWKVFKSPDPAGQNVLYVFSIDPSVKGADYTVTNILNEGFPAEVQALYKQYVDSLANRNIINLTLLSELGK